MLLQLQLSILHHRSIRIYWIISILDLMTHEDVVKLIEDGVSPDTFVWADLGAGSGNFTLALDSLLGFDGTIFALDRNLDILRNRIQKSYVRSTIHLLESDLTSAKNLLPPLDGVLMANTLHYVKDPLAMLADIKSLLPSGGSFILVEYDREDANKWVPYPISYVKWQRLAIQAGFTLPDELNRMPSIYSDRELYSALCFLV